MQYRMDSFEDKVVLITGGAGGIGHALAKQCLKSGAKGIAIVDFSEEQGRKAFDQLNIQFKNKVIFIRCDVTDKEKLDDAFQLTVTTFKQLDVVINNAGIVEERDWKKTVSVNLVAVIEGTYLAMQKYLPSYKSGEEGVIINTASVLGLISIQSAPVYCATKHGVVGLGKSLGGDEIYNKYQVRVLTICPGLVDTALVDLSQGDDNFFISGLFDKECADLKTEVQQAGKVAEALVYVLKNGKSGSVWVTENNQPVYEVVAPPYCSMKN